MLVNQNETFKFRMTTDEQLYRLHNASLEVLERIGVVFYDEKALKTLKDGGAIVKGNRVRIPAAMVEAAIKSAPSRIVVADLDGNRNMKLEHNNVNFGGGTELPSFTDPYTREVRATVISDIENIAKVVEKCDNYDYVSNNGLACDVPQDLHDLYSLRALRSYCHKPNFVTATNYGNLKAMIDIAAEMAGGYEELRLNPTLVLYNEPVSPLLNGNDAVQKLMLCAEYGIPTTYASGGVSGGTSPCTLSGSIVQSNAEGLAGLVLHQLINKGAPFIYGYVYGAMDMRTTVNVYGGPELGMVHTIMSELGKFYNLPTYGTAGCTDAITIDAQAGLEGMYSIMCAALSGANIVHDVGYTGVGAIGSLEMVLLDEEIISYVKRFVKGIDYTDEAFAIDVIEKVGPGGDYLSQKHTMNHFKTEVYYPKFMNRKMFPSWEREGKPSLESKLNKRALQIIEKDNSFRLTEAELKLFDDVISERRKQIDAENK